MTKTDRQLENELVSMENKILNAGEFISATCEGIPDEGVVTYDDGLVLTDPVSKADEIIKTANEIKKMTIQYQALTKLEDKVIGQNKKAVGSEDSLTTDSL
ncbi:hypothetical protein FOL85_01540 [Lactobacillus reuteri]|uniref:hypothetical protein n=1 Tax=Limosilactobacillus reuteri TaxID=1598 RepID=UPI00146BF32D|nr:hypothetical protein [Limosilactobacillus reuteri]NMV51827.1 hypothetical protein [Limosilactobacillus reuteri]NMV55488.1 hypothetical protein [Limosilactobacillus reuteri]NMV65186.1 hypothetical protein [Limosilactobacillus reuteri]